jgi:ribosome modulation factor
MVDCTASFLVFGMLDASLWTTLGVTMDDNYHDGFDACADGLAVDACPHQEGTSARSQWIRGWLDFLPIREEWESAIRERVTSLFARL